MARKTPRYFGSVRKLKSGRFQARYTGPDGRRYEARSPEGRPMTFDNKETAEAFLAIKQADILRGAWLPPAEPKATPITVRAYAEAWLADRDLEQTTRDHYAQLLRDHILPVFGDVAVTAVTPSSVREWHARLKTTTGPTARAHAYGLLRTLMHTAVADEIRDSNPCRVRGGGQVKRAVKIRPSVQIGRASCRERV